MIKSYPKPPKSSEGELRSAIAEAKEGNYPYPFIIAGLAPSFFADQGVCAYQLVISPEQEESAGNITKEVAMRIVKANHMKRVHAVEAGRVYECPDNSFIGTWEGYYATKALRHVWPHIESDDRFPQQEYKAPIWARFRGKDAVEVFAPREVVKFLQVIEKEASKGFRRSALAFQRFYEERKVKYTEI